MIKQTTLEGIPSAHNPNKMFHPKPGIKDWTCDCEHYRIYKTPCRHILQKKFENLQELYEHICSHVTNNREMRDIECQDLDDVITYMGIYRSYEMNKLCTLALNIAVMRGSVTADDIHVATNETYSGDRIIGVVFAQLSKAGILTEVGRKRTERKLAHGRKISIYEITETGYKKLQARRPEAPLNER